MTTRKRLIGDPGQVLDVLRDVLVEHMDNPGALPEYQIQSAVYVGGHTGRLMSVRDITRAKDVPCGLRLTMRSGHEYDLLLMNCQLSDDSE